MVCRNESIDESNASLAKDLRLLVRERIAAGDSDEAAMAFIVERYGEYVLLKPNARGSNLILWLAGPVMFGLAVLIGAVYIRRRGRVAPVSAENLTSDEEARLKEILDRS